MLGIFRKDSFDGDELIGIFDSYEAIDAEIAKGKGRFYSGPVNRYNVEGEVITWSREGNNIIEHRSAKRWRANDDPRSPWRDVAAWDHTGHEIRELVINSML